MVSIKIVYVFPPQFRYDTISEYHTGQTEAPLRWVYLESQFPKIDCHKLGIEDNQMTSYLHFHLDMKAKNKCIFGNEMYKRVVKSRSTSGSLG